MTSVRTRFAPSPTGALHGGVIRTALYSWLLARQSGGQFILRIEDTDQKREVEGSTDNIKETLKWLGLEWDEGPDKGGPYKPYVQSERLESYLKYAKELVSNGLAYADPYTVDELQALRDKANADKRPFLFRDHRPETPPTWNGSQPLRVKLEPKSHKWNDAIMGEVTMGPEMVDDFIIIKADGFPTYNFCHVIDDHEMKISHVLRSQEFLSSIPKYLGLHEALGWESPINVTVPPVLRADGKAKLSKRAGAKSMLEYRDQGFLPEAMINFLATTGWNDGTEQEIFTIDELIQKFSLGRVQKSGGVFDEQRLVYMNGFWIRRLSLDDLYVRSLTFWPESAELFDESYKKAVLGLVQERLKYLAELPELTNFFFEEPKISEDLYESNKQLKKLSKDERKSMLAEVLKDLEISDFSVADLETRLRGQVEKMDTKSGVLFSLIRAAVTGSNVAPGLFETLHVLGKEKSLNRIKSSL